MLLHSKLYGLHTFFSHIWQQSSYNLLWFPLRLLLVWSVRIEIKLKRSRSAGGNLLLVKKPGRARSAGELTDKYVFSLSLASLYLKDCNWQAGWYRSAVLKLVRFKVGALSASQRASQPVFLTCGGLGEKRPCCWSGWLAGCICGHSKKVVLSVNHRLNWTICVILSLYNNEWKGPVLFLWGNFARDSWRKNIIYSIFAEKALQKNLQKNISFYSTVNAIKGKEYIQGNML